MIEAKKLTKRYDSVLALEPLDLQIAEGEIFGYVGPNGSGKTTTIRMLCGLLTPSGGTATVAGFDVVDSPKRVRESVGYMPDHLTPYEGMRVWEYLDFFAAAYGLPRKTRQQRIAEVLELTGAEAMKDYFVDTLSHGMKQLVGVARTLVHDPKVLFLDEPTNGLDPRARVEMRLLLAKLRDLGKTILVSSHILPELAHLCDRVGFMEKGRLIACGTVEQVQQAVRPHRLIEVELLSDAAAAEQAVATLLPEARLKGSSCIGNLLRLEIQAEDVEIAQLLAKLVNGDHQVVGYREVASDLEEAFMALTASGPFGSRREED